MTFKCNSHKRKSPIVWGVVLDISRLCGALISEHQSIQKVWNFRHESLTDLAPHSRRKKKRLQLHWYRRPKTCTVIKPFKALSWHSLKDYQMHAHKHLASYKILKYWQFLRCLLMITTYTLWSKLCVVLQSSICLDCVYVPLIAGFECRQLWHYQRKVFIICLVCVATG